MPLLEISGMKGNIKYICLTGNLGCGKSTLAKIISDYFNWNIIYESVLDNPYLPLYYNDMHNWAFHLQIYFLSSRAEQHLVAYLDNNITVMDRSIYEDAFVFVPFLYGENVLNTKEVETYNKMYNLVVTNIPEPDLFINLKCDANVLKKRVEKRGQEFDKDLSLTYLKKLNSYYEEFIYSFNKGNEITINTTTLDLVNNKKDVLNVMNQIENQLNVKRIFK